MALWYLLLIMQNVELLLMAVKQYLQHGTPACQLLMVCLYLLQLSCHVSKLLLHVGLCHLQEAQRLLVQQCAAYKLAAYKGMAGVGSVIQ